MKRRRKKNKRKLLGKCQAIQLNVQLNAKTKYKLTKRKLHKNNNKKKKES